MFVNYSEYMTDWAIAILSVDRALHIYNPIGALKRNSIRNSKIGFVICSLLIFTIQTMDMWMIIFPNLQVYYTTMMSVYTWAAAVPIVQVSIVAISNIIVIITILVRKYRRNMHDNKQNQNSEIIKMIMMMTTVYFVLRIPVSIKFAINMMNPTSNMSESMLFMTIMNNLHFLNSALNLPILYLSGKVFRKNCKQFLSPCTRCCCAPCRQHGTHGISRARAVTQPVIVITDTKTQ